MLLVATLVTGGYYGYLEGRQDADQRAAAERAAENDPDEARRECAERHSIVEEALRCFQEAEKRSRDEQRAEQDLDAQRQMSEWADRLFWLTFALGTSTLGVTGLGVYWVKETLTATQQTLEVTRDIGATELAAYLTVIGGGYEIDDRKTIATIDVRNSGPTPARHIEYAYHAHKTRMVAIEGGYDTTPIRRIEPMIYQASDIAPGTTGTIVVALLEGVKPSPGGISEGDMEPLVGTGWDFIDLHVRWVDRFGTRRFVSTSLVEDGSAHKAANEHGRIIRRAKLIAHGTRIRDDEKLTDQESV